jgi:hypothetical protein
MMILSLTLRLLADDDVNDADDADNVNNANYVNDADTDDVNNKKRRKQSIEEEKESRLDTSLDRIERLVMCCFFASLVVSQAKFTNEFAFSKD